jgi:hypothetical protein
MTPRRLGDLRKGALFETALTHRKGKIEQKDGDSVRVLWADGGRRSFTTKGGAQVMFPTKRRGRISALTEVL